MANNILIKDRPSLDGLTNKTIKTIAIEVKININTESEKQKFLKTFRGGCIYSKIFDWKSLFYHIFYRLILLGWHRQ